jgi:hypothetical protein
VSSRRLARSRGRRRKRRGRPLVISVSLAAVAFTAGGVALAGLSLSSLGSPGTRTAAAPVPVPSASPSPAGLLKITSAGSRAESKNEEKASGPSKFTDTTATAYFVSRWKDHAATRVKDIRTTGRYLRIYTNLPEGDRNSKDAITLCKRGLEYLSERGVANPVVFVQAKFGGNGNPVLANVLGPDDSDCRVTTPKPK